MRIKGFTLFEVLIAIAVIGVALVGAMEMFGVASSSGKQAENLSVATNLAQEKIEQIKNLVRAGTSIAIGTGSNSGDSFLPDLTDVSTDSYLSDNLYLTESDSYGSTPASLSKMNPARRVDRVTRVTWAAGADTYKKIQVTVFWQEKGQTRSCGLATLIRQ